MNDSEETGGGSPSASESGAAAKGWSSWSLEKKLTIVIIPLVVALIGVGPTIIGALSSDENEAPPSSSPNSPAATQPVKREVARFSGVVGNFELSRAFITFLEDNDGGAVQLEEVGFNEAGPDDFITETIPKGDGTSLLIVSYVQVWTECDPPIPGDVQPEFGMGCMATSFEIEGPETEDAQGYTQHGVPMYDGFFRVDVSGNLQNGVSPIFLKPLTRAEATTG